MPETGQYFACEKCDRRFPYTPAMAGKKVRCKCGYVFVPTVLTAVEKPADEYDLSPEEPAAPKPAMTVAADPQPLVAPSHVLPYAHRRPVAQAQEELEKVDKFKNIYLPVALTIVGVGLRCGQLFLPAAAGHPVVVMIGALIAATVLNVVLMLSGVFLAARVLDADFGAVKWAVIKLTAMSIIGGAAASFVISLDFKQGGIQGPLIALHLLILIYWAGFSTLFELDMQEAMFTVVIVMFLQTGAFCVASGWLH